MISLTQVIITDIFGMCICFILFMERITMIKDPFPDSRMYICMQGLSFGMCLLDIFAFAFDGVASPWARLINVFSNSMLEILTLLFTYSFVIYLKIKLDADHIMRDRIIFSIPLGILAMGSLLNFVVPVYFRIGDDNVYVREPAIMIVYAVVAMYYLYALFLTVKSRRKTTWYTFSNIIFCAIPVVIASVSQFFIYGISVTSAATALTLLVLNTSIQNERAYVDELSALLNRHYLNQYFDNIASDKKLLLGGIMLDIDSFKSINDTYGHDIGDEAIRDTGKILRDISVPLDLTVRYGGDEFIILKKVIDPAELEVIKEDIAERVDKFNNEKDRPYKLAFSMGTAVFYNGADTYTSFLKRMDERMYIEKQRKRSKVTIGG